MFLIIAFVKLLAVFLVGAVVLGIVIGTVLGVIKGSLLLYKQNKERAMFDAMTEEEYDAYCDEHFGDLLYPDDDENDDDEDDEDETPKASKTKKAAVAAVALGAGAYVGTKFGKSIV